MRTILGCTYRGYQEFGFDHKVQNDCISQFVDLSRVSLGPVGPWRNENELLTKAFDAKYSKTIRLNFAWLLWP